ncbi:putative DNA-binding protein [Archaeoglobus sulfaticallidus PM70-1]|uniref:UPF0251 protein Asulf_02204 n=1 Tax=Archaeoglobus sulfaticallidus PM70-1 TaxID=387631 RepID=N0BIL2_9EURY|nr:DUF134 domain-containing protein [Archaeoglobus sulfaticallidus]AGK62157.1 putative DNA-binding protein [Archaeoglobus sulfaticallidus PM70-1]
MGRRKSARRICYKTKVKGFIPKFEDSRPELGDKILLTHEEIEALRLVDLLGMTHEEASIVMGVSRKAFWRDLKRARRKLVTALVEGKAIEIEEGEYVFEKIRLPKCRGCEHDISELIVLCPTCGRGYDG